MGRGRGVRSPVIGWRVGGLVVAVLVFTSGAPAIAQEAPEEVPCPRADVERPPHMPPPPDLPPHGTGDRQIGGVGLDTAGLTVPPDAPEPPETISATSWLVADLDTGEVLGACGPHEYGPPASTIKLLLTLALLDDLDPDEQVEITREDLDIVPGSSAVGLVEGGEYSIETLWLGLLLNSGNEAARALARVGGGERGLAGGVAAMNAEARRLQARQTVAVNPSGLDADGQLTSAYDLALIARQLFDREDFLEYIGTERAEIPAQPDLDAPGFEFQNQNRLLFNYDGAIGGKTGYTDLARQTYVGVAERDGRRLVVSLLGAEREPMPSWQQGAALLDWGFAVPDGSSVGTLVEPQSPELVATPLPDPSESLSGEAASRAPAPAPTTSAVGLQWSPVTMVGVAIAAVGVFMLLLVISRQLIRTRGR